MSTFALKNLFDALLRISLQKLFERARNKVCDESSPLFEEQKKRKLEASVKRA
jgi:hypothetical protein